MSLTRETLVLSEDVTLVCWILAIQRAEDGELEFWFKAHDVATFLEYGNPEQAARRNVRAEWKKKWSDFAIPVNFRGRENSPILFPHTVFVNEKGLVALANRCKKPQALRLQDWVNGEMRLVLGRRGGYLHTDHVRDLLNDISVQVAELEDRAAPMSDAEATRHTFVLFKRGCPTEYRAIRCQQRNLEESLARIQDLDTYECVLHCENIPNSINVLVRSKEILRREGLRYEVWGGNKIMPSDPGLFEEIVMEILEGDHRLSTSLASGEMIQRRRV